VGRNEAPSELFLIVLGFKSALDRSNVGDDALLRQVGKGLSLNNGRVWSRLTALISMIGGKIQDLLVVQEPPGIEEILQPAAVHIKHSHFIIQAERLHQP
jgi:hypothetical protein